MAAHADCDWTDMCTVDLVTPASRRRANKNTPAPKITIVTPEEQSGVDDMAEITSNAEKEFVANGISSIVINNSADHSFLSNKSDAAYKTESPFLEIGTSQDEDRPITPKKIIKAPSKLKRSIRKLRDHSCGVTKEYSEQEAHQWRAVPSPLTTESMAMSALFGSTSLGCDDEWRISMADANLEMTGRDQPTTGAEQSPMPRLG